MAITVKHSKTSLIADAGDATLVQPSDWNSDHTLTGLGTMAEQNANAVAITGGTMSGVTVTGYIPTTQKAAALGVATLDAGGTVPLSQIPASIQGGVSYQGTWNASTNTPTLSNGVGTKGYYYVVSVAGSTNLDGITAWNVGDWAIFNGTVWQKVDNTDAVTSVNGYTGTVVLTNTDISGFGTMSTQNANAVAITGGTINGTTIGATTASTGAFTTATASTSVTTPIVQATNSGGLSLKNSAGTTQISMGGGGGDNVSINVATNINGANAQIDISPTGTGHVHMKPTGTGSIEIAPTNVGTMDNMTIGATTPKAITGTTITATTFSGSGASLTSIPNSALVNSAITINGTSTSLGGSISVGTVTSVTGTSPVVSSGGATPAISMPAATTSVSGYLTSTDWTTFNGKQPAGTYVTSVAATSPVTSSGGTTPTIAMPAATTSVSGYLTSADWTTFNNKGNGTVTSVTGTAPVVSSGGATPAISMPAATGSVNGYLTSTDWTTFNNKGAGTVTSVAATVPSFLSISGSPITTSGTLALSYSGTALPVANGGSGQTSYTDGQLLIGNTTGNTLTKATLTAGTGISITNGAGSITVASTASSGSFVRVGGGTLIAASAITVDGCFTSTYKNYRIYINTIYAGTDDTDAFLQFRASGSTNSTSNYVYQTNYINAAVNAGTAASSTGATSFTLYDNMDNLGPFVGWLEILNPQVTDLTEGQWFLYANDGSNRKQMLGFGFQNQATSFDGFTLTLSAGTLTGTYDIYGMAR